MVSIRLWWYNLYLLDLVLGDTSFVGVCDVCKAYVIFLESAPSWNPRTDMIKGSICGFKVEDIFDPMIK